MKNKKYLLASTVALFAVLVSACGGVVTETTAQTTDAQSAPAAEVALNPNANASTNSNGNAPRNNQAPRIAADGPSQDGRQHDLTSAAETLGVTVEELQQALEAAKPAECADASSDQNGQPSRDPNCRPDLNVAAETLGVTVEELQAALGGDRGQRDLTSAAETLGVTVEELQAAFDSAKPAECTDGQPSQGVDCRADLDAVASTLGVTVEDLQAALGKDQKGLDFAAAAEALGVTEEELQAAFDSAKPAECTTDASNPKDPNCRPDLETVAGTLGVTVEELQQVLGSQGGHGPHGRPGGQNDTQP